MTGASPKTPLWFQYDNCWQVQKDGKRLLPEDLKPHLLRLLSGMKEYVTIPFESATEDRVKDELTIDVDGDKKRVMFAVSDNAADTRAFKREEVRKNKRTTSVQVTLSTTSVDERDEEHASGAVIGEGSKGVGGGSGSSTINKKRRVIKEEVDSGGGEGGAGGEDGAPLGYMWNESLTHNVSRKILDAWEATRPTDGGPDNLWFVYLLDALIGAISIMSEGQLGCTWSSIMGFNPEATALARDQFFHLDLPPAQLYPHLVQAGSTADNFVPRLTKAELQQANKRGDFFFPSSWLYFAAFDNNHAIKAYKYRNGTDLLFAESDTLLSKQNLGYMKGTQFFETISLPFGSLGVVAGSIIHCGVGTDANELPMPPRFRMHSFCHVKGKQEGLSISNTYLWQKS